MDCIMIIGFISSISTLILFFMYFIGKFIIIKSNQSLIRDKIEAVYNNDAIDTYKIVESYDVGGEERLIITSINGINYIKCYKQNYDCETCKLTNAELVFEHGFLNIGNSIEINTVLVEGIPQYKIEYETSDFMIGEMYLQYNGKNGIASECVRIKHTLKSYIYYLTN